MRAEMHKCDPMHKARAAAKTPQNHKIDTIPSVAAAALLQKLALLQELAAEARR